MSDAAGEFFNQPRDVLLAWSYSDVTKRYIAYLLQEARGNQTIAENALELDVIAYRKALMRAYLDQAKLLQSLQRRHEAKESFDNQMSKAINKAMGDLRK